MRQQVQRTDCDTYIQLKLGGAQRDSTKAAHEGKNKRPLGDEGNNKKRPRYNNGLGGAYGHMAKRKDDSDQRRGLRPVELGVWTTEKYLWGFWALQSPTVAGRLPGAD